MDIKKLTKKLFSGKESKTIWARYMKFITPSVIALVIVMNIITYMFIAESTKNAIIGSCYRTVSMEADIIDNVFYRYISDLNVLSMNYDPNDIDGFMKFAKNFTHSHVNPYSYIRIWTPTGESYTTLSGRDTTDATWRKPFRKIKEEGKDMCINMAHESAEAGYEVFTISIPVKNAKGELLGIVCAAFPSSVIDDKLSQQNSKGASGFIALVDDECSLRLYHEKVINSSVEALVKKGFNQLDDCIYGGLRNFQKYKQKLNGGYYYTPDGWKMACHFTNIGDTGWFLALNVPNIILYMDIYKIMALLLITGILTIVVVLVIIKYVTKRVIMLPLENINKFSNDFANGKLYSTEAENITSNDELGKVRDNIRNMQERLIDVVGAIRNSSDEISSSSTKIKDTVLKISEDALIQSACMDNMQGAVENMTRSIQQNAQIATDAKNNSEDISVNVDIITKASGNTLEGMQNVINKIKVINEISSRTDLLAINASVEAARAGENGKGFAVVAAEIRKLAEHCQKASKEINEMSSESLHITQKSSELIGNITPKIMENADKISKIFEICNEQLAMTMDISRSIMQLVDITSNNSQSADDMQVSTQVLYHNMENLKNSMEFFSLDQDSDKHNALIIAEIEKHTSELLKLKSQLVSLAERQADTGEAEDEFAKAMEVVAAGDGKTDKQEEEIPVAEGSEASDEDSSSSKPETQNTDQNDDFFGQTMEAEKPRGYISKKSNDKTDSDFESF